MSWPGQHEARAEDSGAGRQLGLPLAGLVSEHPQAPWVWGEQPVRWGFFHRWKFLAA